MNVAKLAIAAATLTKHGDKCTLFIKDLHAIVINLANVDQIVRPHGQTRGFVKFTRTFALFAPQLALPLGFGDFPFYTR